MRISSVFLALTVATLPSLAFADAAAQNPAPTVVSDPDAIVCKSTPSPTGTRLGSGRECHPQRDWDQREKDARKAVEDKQIHGLQSCLGNCGG